MSTFSSSDFNVQGHILSTSRDALRKEPFYVLQLVRASTWLCLRGRDYGMVATSFGMSNILFNFQLINSKHKLLKFEIVLNNSQNLK
jgi:hypothetical protein